MASDIPPRSNQARIATLLERRLQWSARWGTRGMLVSAFLFVGYVLTGWILTVFNSPWAPSEYLSITGDPGFALTGTLVSLFVVQTTVSFILYHFLTGVEDEQSQFVLLMSYVGLGFGGAVLRVLLPPSIAFLSNWL